MNPQNSQSDYQLLLKSLERFGFKFFGYSENNIPLVIAPNGQIVDINLAKSFLENELKKARSQGSGNIEGQLENIPQTLESKVESKESEIENLEKSLEIRREEKVLNLQSQQANDDAKKSPVISLPSQSESLFADGYNNFNEIDLDLRNPQNVIILEDFIQNNAKKSNSDPKKWLSHMFQKAIQELRESGKI